MIKNMASGNSRKKHIVWDKCFICQLETTVKLRSTKDGHKMLDNMLLNFAAVNGLDFDSSWLESIVNLEETLTLNNAAYHHSCSSKYNQRMLTRAIDREDKARKKNQDDVNASMEVSSPPCKRRSGVPRKELQKLMCCFCRLEDVESNLCAAGTFHAKRNKANSSHVHSITQKWIEMAKITGDDELLRILSTGDVASNEVFYHKPAIKGCLQLFERKYEKINDKENRESEIESEIKWKKLCALNKIYFHISEEERTHPSSVFEVKALEAMYIDLLKNAHPSLRNIPRTPKRFFF